MSNLLQRVIRRFHLVTFVSRLLSLDQHSVVAPDEVRVLLHAATDQEFISAVRAWDPRISPSTLEIAQSVSSRDYGIRFQISRTMFSKRDSASARSWSVINAVFDSIQSQKFITKSFSMALRFLDHGRSDCEAGSGAVFSRWRTICQSHFRQKECPIC